MSLLIEDLEEAPREISDETSNEIQRKLVRNILKETFVEIRNFLKKLQKELRLKSHEGL